MKYHSLQEYLHYTTVADEHPELIHLFEELQAEHSAQLVELVEIIDRLKEELKELDNE